MKISAMTETQKKVYFLCKEACDEFIGGWENAREDAEEGSDDWNMANKMLSQPHDTLVDWILSEVRFSFEWRKLDNLHFASLSWARERIDKILVRWGY